MRITVNEPTDFVTDWRVLDLAGARELLTLRGGNIRGVSTRKADLYRRQMTEGTWAWQSTPFAYVSTDDVLVDGQHKLTAYVQYLEGGGEPKLVEIRLGCPDWWAHIFDAGQLRTNTQRTKATGTGDYSNVSSISTALYNLATSGRFHATDPQPPTFILNLLGDANTPTVQREVIQHDSRLYTRVYRRLSGTPKSAFGVPAVGAALAIWTVEDYDRAWEYVLEMTRAAEFAATRTSSGPAAIIDFARLDRHVSTNDASRLGAKSRIFAAFMQVWDEPTLTVTTLERRLLAKQPGSMIELQRKMYATHQDDWTKRAQAVFEFDGPLQGAFSDPDD
jgi:hypothetical protein